MLGVDVIGHYAKWGDNGHRYYYHNKTQYDYAVKRALAQGRAIHANYNWVR